MSEDVKAFANGIGIMSLLSDALERRRRKDRRGAPRIDPNADLIESGLVDSLALLDIIVDTEQQSGRRFNANDIDFEGGLTLQRLAAAFTEAA